MIAVTFDTLKFANMLKASGVPDKQAEGRSEAFSEIIQVDFKHLATKDDLVLVRDSFTRDIGELRRETKAEFADVRKEMQTEFVAVRKEIGELRKETQAEFVAVRKEMQVEFAAIRTEMTANNLMLLHAIENLGRDFRHDFEKTYQKLRSEQVLIRWMLGVTLTGVVGMFVRMVFYSASR